MEVKNVEKLRKRREGTTRLLQLGAVSVLQL
jgi:hypothetical protein